MNSVLSSTDSKEEDRLVGLRLLLVEDDFLVGLGIRKMLEQFGCMVFGPMSSYMEGLKTLEKETIELAVLDVNVGGGSIMPLAEALRDRDTPFLFVTGYNSPHMLSDEMRQQTCLQKPVDGTILQRAMLDELS